MQRFAFAVYYFFSFLVALATVYCICLAYHLGPFRDMWIAMDFIRSYFDGSFHWPDFFALHGGAHRLAVPRLFFLLEYGFFSGTNVFLIIASLLFQSSVVWLVWKILQQEAHIPVCYRWFLTAMAVLLMFNATQLENFIYTFDMQWFLTSASAVWALNFWNIILKNISGNKKNPASVFSWACITTLASLFSSFSGLCLLLVLPALAIAHRVSKKILQMILLLLAGAIAWYTSGPFAEGGHWGGDHQIITFGIYVHFLWHVALVWIKWTALYFGSPLGREYFWPGSLFAYGSLFFLAWNWMVAIRNGAKTFTSFQMTCLAIALFAAIVGISTGLGRMYFVNTADEDRYQSIVAIYWLGIFAFALSRALQLPVQESSGRFKYMALSVIVFWTALVIPIASIKNAQAEVNFFDRVRDADLAVTTGQWDYSEIKDTLILGDKWKKINRPEMHASFLREQHWGMFASREAALLGTRVENDGISADRCEGGVYAITAVSAPYRGYRIIGHGQDVLHETLLKSYVAIDETGLIVGLGRLQREKNSLLPISWQPLESAHWLLYTENLNDQHNLQILGELDGGGYCVMASAKLPSPNT